MGGQDKSGSNSVAENHFKLKSVFWGVITASVVLFVSFYLFNFFVDIKFISSSACLREQKIFFVEGMTVCLLSDNWNDSTYLSAVTGFYSTVISLLIGILALTTWLSFAILRSSHKREIEQQVVEEVPHYLGGEAGSQILQAAISKSGDKAIEALFDKKFDELHTQIRSLSIAKEAQQSIIETLTKRLEEEFDLKLDDGESEADDNDENGGRLKDA